MSAWSRFCSHFTPVGMTERPMGDFFRKNLFSNRSSIWGMGACRLIRGDTLTEPARVSFTGFCTGDLTSGLISVPRKFAGFFFAAVMEVFSSFMSSCRVAWSHCLISFWISLARLIGPSTDIMKSSAYLTYLTLI